MKGQTGKRKLQGAETKIAARETKDMAVLVKTRNKPTACTRCTLYDRQGKCRIQDKASNRQERTAKEVYAACPLTEVILCRECIYAKGDRASGKMFCYKDGVIKGTSRTQYCAEGKKGAKHQ